MILNIYQHTTKYFSVFSVVFPGEGRIFRKRFSYDNQRILLNGTWESVHQYLRHSDPLNSFKLELYEN